MLAIKLMCVNLLGVFCPNLSAIMRLEKHVRVFAKTLSCYSRNMHVFFSVDFSCANQGSNTILRDHSHTRRDGRPRRRIESCR